MAKKRIWIYVAAGAAAAAILVWGRIADSNENNSSNNTQPSSVINNADDSGTASAVSTAMPTASGAAELTEDDVTPDRGDVTAEKTYGLEDTWTVDGQFSFTITNCQVTTHDAASDELFGHAPETIYLIQADYKNIGYKGPVTDIEDNIEKVNGLEFTTDNFNARDNNGTFLIDYRNETLNENKDINAAVGETVQGAQYEFAVDSDVADTLDVTVSMMSSDGYTYKASFELPVQK